MKIIIVILGFINGGYMLADGLFVMLKGKYIGPDKPGPWANIFYKFNMDVFKLGPMFITFGIIWLVFIIGLLTKQTWTYISGIIISILTLWYLPVGTIISITVLLLLLRYKSNAGL